MFERALIDQVTSAFHAQCPDGSLVWRPHPRFEDETSVEVDAKGIRTFAGVAREHLPFLMDVCGVDYPERAERLEVVYHLAGPRRRLRVKASLADGAAIPSLVPIYPAANWFEREAFDLFGANFSEHPNLSRILCHRDFVGHPLRKDYAPDRRQSLSTPLEHSHKEDLGNLTVRKPSDALDKVWINIGPAHPATHGTLRFMAVVDGETISDVDIEIGYLHRCFEKMVETHTYTQAIPYTDRLNYCSAPINNNTWCRTVEKMMEVQVPPRAEAIRVVLDEFARCIDHFVCIMTNALDLGGMTNFWYGMRAREAVYDLFEKLCGARLTVSLSRIGGMGFDLPDGWVQQALETCDVILQARREIDTLCTKNRIFMSRMVGVTPITADDAVAWGFTGPCLRAAGLARDLRKDQPYGGYDRYDFDVPIGTTGDCYDRYMVRMEEIVQSVRIIRQALQTLPGGPIRSSDPKVSLPEKEQVYGNIEGLMHQFMKVIHDVRPPPGEVYHCGEAANGELGFFVVSDGSSRPYRVKCRPPCFAIFQAMPSLLRGHMIADVVAALGSINIIAGELDR